MQHLAMIMDGNRRWAKKNSIINPYNEKSQEAVKTAITFCIKQNIPYLSLFAFSLENFKRPLLERERVFSLLKKVLTHHLDELIEEGIRIRFIGDRALFPSFLKPHIEEAEEKSAPCSRLNLNILFCYGGQQELAHATKKIAQAVKEGRLRLEDISEQTFKEELWTAGMPNPDLIIRTSGHYRLSNFLLYQAAYSELAFVDCYWPEITEDLIQECVQKYELTKKNYGQ